MEVISYSAFRGGLAKALDKVNDDQAPIMITRQNGKPAIVMSLEEFNAYTETTYLSASPKNAERLNRSITELEAGRGKQHELIET